MDRSVFLKANGEILCSCWSEHRVSVEGIGVCEQTGVVSLAEWLSDPSADIGFLCRSNLDPFDIGGEFISYSQAALKTQCAQSGEEWCEVFGFHVGDLCYSDSGRV